MEKDAEIATARDGSAPAAALMYGGLRNCLPVIQDARLLFSAARFKARFAHADHPGGPDGIMPEDLSRRYPARFWRHVVLNGRQIEEHRRDRGRPDPLADIYSQTVRGLFAAADQADVEAVDRHRALGRAAPRPTRLVEAAARLVGLRAARSLAGLVDSA
jgi:hypothetical protein